ncbi:MULTISPECIES: hypothetical protein [Pseudomonas]|uniref:Uncharacterized protein n=1 Tax=Pseudomonas folii TaxID=2762593 RepID=A0ABR7AW18_9PSED|nr:MULTISPECIES: hypothetical protein [Pseudomonas]MBC3949095.1 hypothetical protein [Pseudomonas folii]
MITASISALHHLVSQAVARKTQDDVATDAFSVPTGATSPVPAVDPVAQNSGSQQNEAYDEAFAKMLLSLKTATQNTDNDAAPSFVSAGNDNSIAARDSAVTSEADVAEVASKFTSAQQEFSDYMNLTPAEKMREQLTGVSKEEYESMSPEQKLDADTKLQAALKEQQQQTTADVNSKILAARLALV